MRAVDTEEKNKCLGDDGISTLKEVKSKQKGLCEEVTTAAPTMSRVPPRDITVPLPYRILSRPKIRIRGFTERGAEDLKGFLFR